MAPSISQRRLIGVPLAVVLIGATAGITIAAPPPKPPPAPDVVWNPVSLDLTVARGSATTGSAAFTVAKKTTMVKISDGGTTASFVTVSPMSLSSVAAGVPVTVTVSVAVPASTALGDYAGSVSVSSGKKSLANALPLTLHVVAPTAHLYWTNASVGIGRALADGSNPDSVFIPAADAGQPVGLARDAQHIYWTDVNNHRIGRANLDGTNPDPNFLPLTYTDPTGTSTQPIGIAVDSQYIYWTDADYPSIGRANLDGTNVLPGFIDLLRDNNNVALGIPTGVAVDGQHVYWADEGWAGGSIGRADLNGGNINRNFLIIGGGTEWGVALDAQHVYWTWSVYPGDGFVGRADLDGANANAAFISTHAYATTGLAIDASHLYWSNNLGVNGQIGRADLDGSNIVAALVDLPGGASTGLAVDP